jgi:hypothetical protein
VGAIPSILLAFLVDALLLRVQRRSHAVVGGLGADPSMTVINDTIAWLTDPLSWIGPEWHPDAHGRAHRHLRPVDGDSL